MRAVGARWKAAAGAAVVLAAAGAFLAWGPVGLGSGPLRVGFIDGGQDLSVAPRQDWGLMIHLDAPHTKAVIDRVTLHGGAGYPGPRVRALWTDRDQECGGTFPWRDRRSCAVGGLARLTDQPVPAGTSLRVDIGPVHYPGEAIVAQVAPPARDCWVVTSIVIRYHVGIRHYTESKPVTFYACLTRQDEDAADDALSGS